MKNLDEVLSYYLTKMKKNNFKYTTTDGLMRRMVLEDCAEKTKIPTRSQVDEFIYLMDGYNAKNWRSENGKANKAGFNFPVGKAKTENQRDEYNSRDYVLDAELPLGKSYPTPWGKRFDWVRGEMKKAAA